MGHFLAQLISPQLCARHSIQIQLIATYSGEAPPTAITTGRFFYGIQNAAGALFQTATTPPSLSTTSTSVCVRVRDIDDDQNNDQPETAYISSLWLKLV